MNFWKALLRMYWMKKSMPHLKEAVREIDEASEELKAMTAAIKQSKVMLEGTVEWHATRHEAVVAFCKSGNLFHHDERLKNRLMLKDGSLPEAVAALDTSYQDKAEAFLVLLEGLDVTMRNVNARLVPYYEGLVRFDREVVSLRLDYITHSQKTTLAEKYREVADFFDGESIEEAETFLEIYRNLDRNVRLWNEQYVSAELVAMKDFFDDIDGKSLDAQQRKAVVVDEDANLVVAGAGSGKTLTISAKVKYLVERKGLNPEEILLFSFTRKAADEMEERIKKRLDIPVAVKTFHGLGMGIISRHAKQKPDIEDESKRIIEEYCKREFYQDPVQLKKLIEFFGYYLHVPKGIEEFENLGEHHDYHLHLDFETLKSKCAERPYVEQKTDTLKRQMRTIKDEQVKSQEEVMIANFLFLNGVEYEYERLYEQPTGDEHHRQYRPDFYLPEYGIYIEHFGINDQGRTPWLSPVEEQKYLEGMAWKRELHETSETELIETYSYYVSQGRLLEELEQKLKDKDVKFRDVDLVEIFNRLYDAANKNHFEDFITFLHTFLTLFKSNGYEADQVDDFLRVLEREKAWRQDNFSYKRTKLFLDLFRPIHAYYEATLRERNRIDFNDMINMAKAIVAEGSVSFPYRYIIIDEYQDISVSRFELVRQIRTMTGAKVMCVGDDWQSIYRFAGSDLSLFTAFETYFGKSEQLKIEQTYRNSQRLIDIAGRFVMKNDKQIKKNLYSSKRKREPVVIYGYTGKQEIIGTLQHMIREIVREQGTDTEILLLGRNNFDVRFIEESDDFRVRRNKDGVRVISLTYPDLKMHFLTVHRSKGLEADNVILVNTSNHNAGFPNKTVDDPILSLVLKEQDELAFGEERRLFYVALTRTKNVTYVLTPDQRMSVFVKELIKEQGILYEVIKGNTETITTNPKCPHCIEGYMLVRENGRTKERFLGCSNYPVCTHSLKDTAIVYDQVECPTCSGYMVVREGGYGKFYGCTNYPRYCTQTLQLKEKNRPYEVGRNEKQKRR